MIRSTWLDPGKPDSVPPRSSLIAALPMPTKVATTCHGKAVGRGPAKASGKPCGKTSGKGPGQSGRKGAGKIQAGGPRLGHPDNGHGDGAPKGKGSGKAKPGQTGMRYQHVYAWPAVPDDVSQGALYRCTCSGNGRFH